MNQFIQIVVNYIKAHPYRSLRTGIIVILLISLVLRILYPVRQKPTTTALSIQAPSFDVVNFSNPINQVTITAASTPQQTEAKVYAVNGYIPDNQLFVNIAKVLKLDPALYSKYAYQSRDGQISVGMSNVFKIVDYHNLVNNPAGEIVGLAAAIRSANLFFPTLNLDVSQFSLDESKTKYMGGLLEPTEVDASQATSITLYYRRAVDNLSVSIAASPGNEIIVYVSRAGVFKATIPALFFSQTEAGNSSLVSVTDATTQIKNGNYFIIGQINNPVTHLAITDKIVSFEITSVTLEYRLDEKQKLLLPFYLMSGNAAFANGVQGIPVTLITPAYRTP